MWFLLVQTIPKSNSMNTNAFERAVVHCWINYQERKGAEQLANYYLDEDGWMITNVEHREWVEISNYKVEDEGFEFANEAKKSGSSFFIQTYLADNSE
jgi:hypothetical protein